MGLEGLWWVDPSQQPNTHTATHLPPSRMRQNEQASAWVLAVGWGQSTTTLCVGQSCTKILYFAYLSGRLCMLVNLVELKDC